MAIDVRRAEGALPHRDRLARLVAQLQLRQPLRPREHAPRAPAREQRRRHPRRPRLRHPLPPRHGDRHVGARRRARAPRQHRHRRGDLPGPRAADERGLGHPALRDERERDRRRAPRPDVGAPRHRGDRARATSSTTSARRSAAAASSPSPRAMRPRAGSRSTSATPSCSPVAWRPASRSWSRRRRTCTCSWRSAPPTLDGAGALATGDAVRLTDEGPLTLTAGTRGARGAGLGDGVAPCASSRSTGRDASSGERRCDLGGRGGRRRAGPAGERPHRVTRWPITSLALAAADRDLVVGFDFSFSLPAWFFDARGFTTVDELWAAAAPRRRRWLADVRPSVLGTARPAATRSPRAPAGHRSRRSRRTAGCGRSRRSRSAATAAWVPARSAAGRCSRGSEAQGFAIWPFDDARTPLVVEVYPRACTGAVVKTDIRQRAALLDRRFPRTRSASSATVRSRVTTRSMRPSPRW